MGSNDALTMAPEVHKLLFENEEVRVLDVCLSVAGKTENHWHPRNISYILQGGKMKVTKPIGNTSEIQLMSGEIVPGVEGEHIVENIGDTDIHTIQIEFKN
jgi:oxalate decarboxylase/phosphoglucose isomerase-like protein (cupin superfamily)